MKEVQKKQAKRKIAFGLRHPRGPKQKESDKDLEKHPSGAPVLLYRQESKEREGPFPFIHAEGSTVVVQRPYGRKILDPTSSHQLRITPSKQHTSKTHRWTRTVLTR